MTNNKKFAAVALFTAALAATPMAPAEAHGWHHGDGLLVGAVAGVAGAAVALATLPFHVVAAVATPEPVVYAPPAPAYYPQPTYYAPQPVAYYSYPAGYYNYGYYGYRHGYGYR